MTQKQKFQNRLREKFTPPPNLTDEEITRELIAAAKKFKAEFTKLETSVKAEIRNEALKCIRDAGRKYKNKCRCGFFKK